MGVLEFFHWKGTVRDDYYKAGESAPGAEGCGVSYWVGEEKCHLTVKFCEEWCRLTMERTVSKKYWIR